MPWLDSSACPLSTNCLLTAGKQDFPLQDLGSRQEIIPQDCVGFWFVYQAHPSAHIENRAGGSNVVDGLKNKHDGELFFCRGPHTVNHFAVITIFDRSSLYSVRMFVKKAILSIINALILVRVLIILSITAFINSLCTIYFSVIFVIITLDTIKKMESKF